MSISASAWADLAERLPQFLPSDCACELRCGSHSPVCVGTPGADWSTDHIPGYGAVLLSCKAAERDRLHNLVAACCDLVTESESLSRELAATYGKLALLDELGRALPRCQREHDIALTLAETISCTVAGDGCLLQRRDSEPWSQLICWGEARACTPEEAARLDHLAARERPFVIDQGRLPQPLGLTGNGPSCAVPLRGPEGIEGLLIMGRRQSAPFGSDETKLLELAATQGAGALYRLRQETALRAASLLEHDVAMAARIQQNLLPREWPDLPGWSMAGRLRSARHIGGDYYDVIPARDGCWLVIADVSGHSVPASLATSMVRAALRTALPTVVGPADLLALLDRQLCRDLQHSTLFVSLVVARVRARDGVFVIANAGHPPVLQRHSDGTTTAWDADGAIIGLIGGQRFQELEGRLSPGESLLFHTDGITETGTGTGDPFGLDGLQRCLHDAPVPAEDLLDHIVGAVVIAGKA
ncbi:MAG: PP2C family protein-serine/threonine phosphatase, partial [Planctomycetota bacterium]